MIIETWPQQTVGGTLSPKASRPLHKHLIDWYACRPDALLRKTVMPAVRYLPPNTMAYLHNIVVNGLGAASEHFIQNPNGVAGVTRKYAWRAGLPTGGGGAGRYRLLKHTSAGRVTWWKATHVPGNMYVFDRIVIPRCATCRGTSEPLCTVCNGTGRTGPAAGRGVVGNRRRCVACNANGFRNCPTCHVPPGVLPIVIDGVSIKRTLAEWAA